jgi:hypothetical protein
MNSGTRCSEIRMVLRVRTPSFASSYFSKSELQGVWAGIRGSCAFQGRRKRTIKIRTMVVRDVVVKPIRVDFVLD